MDEKITPNSFQSRLIDIMLRMKVKQIDVSLATGVSAPTVSAWCRGLTLPRKEHMHKLSAFLETTSLWLLQGEGPEISKDGGDYNTGDVPMSARIKERMNKLGIRSVDLVFITGATKGAVSKWVRGGAVPKEPHLSRLAVALETTSNWLVTGGGNYEGGDALTAQQRDYLNDRRKRLSEKKMKKGEVVITINTKANSYSVQGAKKD